MEREKDLALVESYLASLADEKHVSENTLQAYRCDLQKLYDFANEMGVGDVTLMRSSFFRDLEKRLKDSNASDSAVARFVSAVRGYFRYLYREREVRINYGKELENPRGKRNGSPPRGRTRDILTLREISDLLSAPDTAVWQGARDAALMELMYASGMRAGEAILLRYHDLDLQLNLVTIRDPGAQDAEQKARTVPFGDRARRALLHYIEMSRDIFTTPYAFVFVAAGGHTLTRQSVWKIIRRNAAAAGIEKEVSPQTLRRSLIYHLMDNDADEKSIRQMLGISYDGATRRYRGDGGLRERYDRMQKLH